MDFGSYLSQKLANLWDFYEWTFTFADPRVEKWFLMSGFTPTILLTALYLFVVWAGPRFMKNREPFNLRYVIFFYNMFLVLLNFYIFYELLTASYKLGYSLICQVVHTGDDPDELRIAKAIWWFWISKCLEWSDTIFFILRKKINQLTVLHVYHHASIFPVVFVVTRWIPGGRSFFGIGNNALIHVVMYLYYGIAALGPQYQKYLWWKRYLTKLQLIQFILDIVYAAVPIWVSCPFPLWIQMFLFVYAFTILIFFLNFYYQAYLNKKSKKV